MKTSERLRERLTTMVGPGAPKPSWDEVHAWEAIEALQAKVAALEERERQRNIGPETAPASAPGDNALSEAFETPGSLGPDVLPMSPQQVVDMIKHSKLRAQHQNANNPLAEPERLPNGERKQDDDDVVARDGRLWGVLYKPEGLSPLVFQVGTGRDKRRTANEASRHNGQLVYVDLDYRIAKTPPADDTAEELKPAAAPTGVSARVHDLFDGNWYCVECAGPCKLPPAEKWASEIVRALFEQESHHDLKGTPRQLCGNVLYLIQEAGVNIQHFRKRAAEQWHK